MFWKTHGADGLERETRDIFSTLCTESYLVCHYFSVISEDYAIPDALSYMKRSRLKSRETIFY